MNPRSQPASGAASLLRWPAAIALLPGVVVLAASALSGCGRVVSGQLRAVRSARTVGSGIRFQDVAAPAGIRYRWPEQPRPMNILQSFGRGCAFFDYDGDGWQDVLLVGAPHAALFRNLGGGRFHDVTASTGLSSRRGDWRGCAVGDYDGDGFPDLLLTGYRCLALLRNDAGRLWADRTVAAGLDPRNHGHWGASAGFMDLRAGGQLDLVILNYVDYGPRDPQFCQWKIDVRSGCGPSQYRPEFPEVWKNLGGGRFQDATAVSGFTSSHGKGMVLAFTDVDDDGLMDLYVGNDGRPSDLMRNRSGLRFRNTGDASGVAYGSVPGQAIAAMGADWDDFDRDGRLDLVVTAYSNQPYSLLRASGQGLFEHAGDATGIAAATYKPLGFGVKWLDIDNDGWPDLAFANGHVHDNTQLIDPTTRFREPLMICRNQQGRQFVDLVPVLGRELGRPIVGRGLAAGDYDNDGRTDLLVVDYEGEPLLLHNLSVTPGHWLQLDLRSDGANRMAYGARVTARAGARSWVAQVSPASSFLSSSDPRIHLGLGEVARLDSLSIRWPTGRVEELRGIQVDRTLVVREGKGAVGEAPGGRPAALPPPRRLDEALVEAAASGDLRLVRSLLDRGADGSARSADGTPALIPPAAWGRTEIVEALLLKGADPNACDRGGNSALHRAASGGHADTIKALLARGADVNSKDGAGNTPLVWACVLRHRATAYLLIGLGADANAADGSGKTPLIWAADSGDVDLARTLLDRGADPNACDHSRRTSLMWATAQEHPAAVRLLLDRRAWVAARDDGGRTALMWAVWRRDVRTVRMLLDHGADPDARDDAGDTPLIWASLQPDTAVARLLVSRGASINAREKDGKTPLILSVQKRNLPLTRMLLAAKADLNLADSAGVTPLMWAALTGDAPLARRLLSVGANAKVRDLEGRTALIHAARLGQLSVARVLLEAGAPLDAAADNGGTALMWAAAAGRAGVVRALLAAGASTRVRAPDGHTALTLARQGHTPAHREIVRWLLQAEARRPRAPTHG